MRAFTLAESELYKKHLSYQGLCGVPVVLRWKYRAIWWPFTVWGVEGLGDLMRALSEHPGLAAPYSLSAVANGWQVIFL